MLIRDDLLRARVRTVAFVNKRAISAGALISLASERIAMAEGGTIGAATPVQMGDPGGEARPVTEKTVSYMRKEFRATAESRKRPPLVAEAMVDADVEIPGVIAKGKLLTLTTDEALKLKVVDVRADDLEAVLARLGLAGAEIRRATPTLAENVVRFLTHPVVSSLLMTWGCSASSWSCARPDSACRARSASGASPSSSGGTGWCGWSGGKSWSWSPSDSPCWPSRSSSRPASA